MGKRREREETKGVKIEKKRGSEVTELKAREKEKGRRGGNAE